MRHWFRMEVSTVSLGGARKGLVAALLPLPGPPPPSACVGGSGLAELHMVPHNFGWQLQHQHQHQHQQVGRGHYAESSPSMMMPSQRLQRQQPPHQHQHQPQQRHAVQLQPPPHMSRQDNPDQGRRPALAAGVGGSSPLTRAPSPLRAPSPGSY